MPRGTCRWCGEAIVYEKGPKAGDVNFRRRWHPACVDAYNRTDPRQLRRFVRKRDRGICAECGLDTNALRRAVRGRGRTQRLRERGFLPRRSLWELDHVVPLIDGGSHEPSNLQTLCVPCHRKKSAEETRERASRTREVEPMPVARGSQPRKRPEADPSALDFDALLARADETNARVASALKRDRTARPRSVVRAALRTLRRRPESPRP